MRYRFAAGLAFSVLVGSQAHAQAPSSVCTSVRSYWGCYVPNTAPARGNTLPTATPSGPRETTIAQILGSILPGDVPTNQPTSGHFYQDLGASVFRYGDRLLIGAAADNPARSTRDTEPRDWLSEVMGATSIGAWATFGATGASISRYGTIGFLTASRSSDARAAAAMLGYTPASIGHASWGINDDTTNPTSTTAWAFYAEAWRMPGVNYQPTFGMETEAVNFGGLAVGASTPYHTNVGGGTYGHQIGCGGGQTSGTSDCDAVLVAVRNPNAFRAGLVFGANSLTGTDGTAGDSGIAFAMELGRNQAIGFYTPETSGGQQGQLASWYRSTVTTAANGTRLEHQNSGLVVSNAVGQAVFSVESTASANAYIAIQSSNSGGAAGLYARGSGSANIGLYPASGGELQMSSPVSSTGGTLPATVAGGYLHINVNGADVRVPLFTPAQAGG